MRHQQHIRSNPVLRHQQPARQPLLDLALRVRKGGVGGLHTEHVGKPHVTTGADRRCELSSPRGNMLKASTLADLGGRPIPPPEENGEHDFAKPELGDQAGHFTQVVLKCTWPCRLLTGCGGVSAGDSKRLAVRSIQ